MIRTLTLSSFINNGVPGLSEMDKLTSASVFGRTSAERRHVNEEAKSTERSAAHCCAVLALRGIAKHRFNEDSSKHPSI
jgi:hypothetical protein